MTAAYYNEHDPYAAQWLRNLISAGHIAPGDVDERSISDVRPDDLRGYAQCHFFAGIGVWSHALRQAGWADDRHVWTGSCPCQPFSAAGKGGGFDDERHLWPHFHWLIGQCRPDVVFGEQVASKDGLGWLDLVQADLEGTGYASGAVDLCAAGVGAPHIRQRLWWFGRRGVGQADAYDPRLEGRGLQPERAGKRAAGPGGVAGGLDDPAGARHVGPVVRAESLARDEAWLRVSGPGCDEGGMADADGRHPGAERQQRGGEQRQQPEDGEPVRLADVDRSAGGQGRPLDGRRHHRSHAEQGAGLGGGRMLDPRRPGPTNGLWRDADWLFCRDGKWRPVEPGTFPLAHGAASRVGRLRAYGNAIVAEAATAFIDAYLDAENEIGDQRHAA